MAARSFDPRERQRMFPQRTRDDDVDSDREEDRKRELLRARLPKKRRRRRAAPPPNDGEGSDGELLPPGIPWEVSVHSTVAEEVAAGYGMFHEELLLSSEDSDGEDMFLDARRARSVAKRALEAALATPREPVRVRIVSLNIMCSDQQIQAFGDAKATSQARFQDPDTFAHRWPYILDVLLRDHDFMFLQEARAGQLEALIEVLPDKYGVVGVQPGAEMPLYRFRRKKKITGLARDITFQHVPIFFDRSRFVCVAHGIELAEYVTIPRLIAWGIFEERGVRNPRSFAVFNNHPDFVWMPQPTASGEEMESFTRLDPKVKEGIVNGKVARRRALDTLVTLIRRHERDFFRYDRGLPGAASLPDDLAPAIVVCGDFNCYLKGDKRELLWEMEKLGLRDMHAHEPFGEKSYHAFNGPTEARRNYNGRIDFIFCSAAFVRVSSSTLREKVRVKGEDHRGKVVAREGYPSDHFPLFAEVELRGSGWGG
ncbi:Endonuclease/exonuclease/phosphatase [Hyaloraphidium curvatum]|nr:Endonuclease/exonuclease/phosphatase [Hyaloraphidium curvatum]